MEPKTMNRRVEVKTKKDGRRRGQTLVEAALVLPILLLFFFGIFEFGRILMVKQVISNAAREAARAAAINLDDTGAISSAQNVSQDYLTRCNVDLAKVTIDPAFTTVNGMDAVQVTISYNYLSSLFRLVPGIPETILLRSQVTMRREA